MKVDESETTVWYKIGTIALKLHNYQLARLGFEQVEYIKAIVKIDNLYSLNS